MCIEFVIVILLLVGLFVCLKIVFADYHDTLCAIQDRLDLLNSTFKELDVNYRDLYFDLETKDKD